MNLVKFLLENDQLYFVEMKQRKQKQKGRPIFNKVFLRHNKFKDTKNGLDIIQYVIILLMLYIFSLLTATLSTAQMSLLLG